MQSDELKRRISAGRGDALADLIFEKCQNCQCSLPMRFDTADIAISGNSIVGGCVSRPERS